MYFQRQIQTKNYDTLPDAAKDEIHLVSYNKNVIPNVVGSYAYRVQKYPADIDLMENVDQIEVHGIWEPATNATELANAFSQKVKTIIRDIEDMPLHYLLDFKAGVDPRYLVVLGKMENGNLTIDEKFIPAMIELTEMGLYTVTEFRAVYELVSSGSDQKVYDAVTKILRNRYILRWNSNEIKKGEKVLPLGQKITLTEAILQRQLVKMDIAAYVNGRFMEVSNIWTFMVKDAQGKYQPITPVPSVDNVPYDIEKLYWSDMFYGPFKVVKRMFSLSRIMYLRGGQSYKTAQYEEILRKTAGFVGGDVSLLYQVKSEIETLLTLNEMEIITKANTNTKVMNQVDSFKNRLANDLVLSDKTVDEFNQLIDAFLDSQDYSLLKALSKYLKEIINERAISFLANTNMNPPPLIMLPTVETARQLTLTHSPMNPFCPVQFQKTYNWSEKKGILLGRVSGSGVLVGGKKDCSISSALGSTALKLAEMLAKNYMSSESKGSGLHTLRSAETGHVADDGALIRIRPALDPEDMARMKLSQKLMGGERYVYVNKPKELYVRGENVGLIHPGDMEDPENIEEWKFTDGTTFHENFMKLPESWIYTVDPVKYPNAYKYEGEGFCNCPMCARRGFHGGCLKCGKGKKRARGKGFIGFDSKEPSGFDFTRFA